MSLEQSIADLQTQAGLLLDLPQEIRDTAVEKIANITSSYTQRISSLEITRHVNAVVGDDEASGEENNPFKTIKKAVDAVPPGGRVTVVLQEDYELTGGNININNKQVLIISDGATRKSLTFERYSFVGVGSTNWCALRNIILFNGGSIQCKGIKIIMPPMDGNWPNLNLASWGAFRNGMFHLTGNVPLYGFFDCEFIIPTNQFVAMMNDLPNPSALFIHSCIFSDQGPNGRLFKNFNDTNGTSTANLPWLLTNLSTI